MPGSPLTGQGGQFGGPQFGWGDVPGGNARSGNSGLNRGRYTNSPEAGLHRGEWQWRGHGPSAQQSYGWDYQGGVGRDEITQRTEARMGSSFQARMAQERSGGLPQGRYAIDYDRGQRTGAAQGDQGVSYDWGWEGHGGHPSGGMQRYARDFQGGGSAPRYGATSQRYGNDFQGGGYGAQGGGWTGSGSRQGRGGYGRDLQSGYDQPRGGSLGGGGGYAGGGYSGGGYAAGGMRGGYGAQGGGMRGAAGGRYGGDYSQPLSDQEFYRRVGRW